MLRSGGSIVMRTRIEHRVMPRHPRILVAGQPHHLIIRGVDRRAMFAGEEDFERFRRLMQRACRVYAVRVRAYVLMTNHVHLLVDFDSAEGAIATMERVGSVYARYFNRRYRRSGPLWERRYRSHPVATEMHLFTLHRYIERNPVRAHMVREAVDYRWSSFGANALGSPDALVTPHPLYDALGATDALRRAAYRQLCEVELTDDELRAIRAASRDGGSTHGPVRRLARLKAER